MSDITLSYFTPRTIEEWIDELTPSGGYSRYYERRIDGEIATLKAEIEYARADLAELEAKMKLAQEQETLYCKAQEVICE